MPSRVQAGELTASTRIRRIEGPGRTRRDLLALIARVAGGSAGLRAMGAVGLAAESTYRGPIRLAGDPKGTSVLILGAGLAGLAAALELRQAGYAVRVLEADDRVGGRCRTVRGGDRLVEADGTEQTCGFAPGLYLNAGPWRIPHHHRAVLDYCRRLGVELEPFIQVNHDAFVHASEAFGGRPQRYRTVDADFRGRAAELLAQALRKGEAPIPIPPDDRKTLVIALALWGGLDGAGRYEQGARSSGRRGWDKPPGGGAGGAPLASRPTVLPELLRSGLWRDLAAGLLRNFQGPLFQPVGGMDAIARAFERELPGLVRTGARVTAVGQTGTGVVVAFEDARTGRQEEASADWCVCTIPLPILSGIELDAGPRLRAAIGAVAYAPAVKVGLQFRRRFWEEDDGIYGGITYTDLPIGQIAYPSTGFLGRGPGVLLGAYSYGDEDEGYAGLAAAAQVRQAVAQGSRIHPQYGPEFETGVAVAWHRMPFAQGCHAVWDEAVRAEHYQDLCAIDGRLVLAGEHASYLSGWQEGAILSALDAVARLHERAVSP